MVSVPGMFCTQDIWDMLTFVDENRDCEVVEYGRKFLKLGKSIIVIRLILESASGMVDRGGPKAWFACLIGLGMVKVCLASAVSEWTWPKRLPCRFACAGHDKGFEPRPNLFIWRIRPGSAFANHLCTLRHYAENTLGLFQPQTSHPHLIASACCCNM